MSLIPGEERKRKSIYLHTDITSKLARSQQHTSTKGALDSLGLMSFSRENQREHTLQLPIELLS